jgi:hypothetical protein
MSSNYPPQVAAYVDAAREAAENAQAIFVRAEERVKEAASELEEDLRKVSESPEGESRKDPTLDIKMRTSGSLSLLAEKAAEHAAKARRAAESARKIAESAKNSSDSPGFTALAEATDKAAAHRDTAELWRKEVNTLAENARKEADAANAAEYYLNLEDFFTRQKPLIYERLEHYDRIATDAGANSDMVFIAEGLPIINGIINVGSTQDALNEAIKWVKSKWGDMADPLLVLSALVFIYVVDRGALDHIHDEEVAKHAAWERIRERVRRLL